MPAVRPMSVAKRVLANLRVFSVGQSIGLAFDEDDDASPEPLALELELASPEAEDVALAAAPEAALVAEEAELDESEPHAVRAVSDRAATVAVVVVVKRIGVPFGGDVTEADAWRIYGLRPGGCDPRPPTCAGVLRWETWWFVAWPSSAVESQD